MIPNFLHTFSNQINGIIHVGAHLGQELIYYNKYNFKKVILFEPQKEIFNKLLSIVKNEDNVECYNFALGSIDEKKIIYQSKGNEGNEFFRIVSRSPLTSSARY